MATEKERTDAVDRIYKEAFENGETGVFDEVVASDYVLHDTTLFGEVSGPDGLKEIFDKFNTGFSGRSVTIDDRIVQENKVVDHFTVTGTHDGEFMDITATGTDIEFDGTLTHRFDNGKLAETTLKYDPRGLLSPIGGTELLTDLTKDPTSLL